jgi:signal transduction histidine kinase/ActR/RegA family two-component response regulator
VSGDAGGTSRGAGTAAEIESRVLVLAPTVRDADVTRALLKRTGLPILICDSVTMLAREIRIGGGAALVTEEALTAMDAGEVIHALAEQPSWSDFPIVVLARGGAQSAAASMVLRSLPNTTLLERPAPMRSVVSAVETAVRGRLRQYHIRDAQVEREMILESERSARAEAERANRVKDEFLATLSHELRTPLNAILGWAQVLRRRMKGDGSEIGSGLEVIERNARLQAQLIEDLLDMSRITSGKIRLDLRPVDPAMVVDAAIESIRPAAASRGVRIESIIDPTGPVLGDSGRLQQVLWNLLSNAVKFTPRGGQVTVSIHRSGSQVELSVADTGLGIRPEFLPHVFERFRQADGSTTRKHGGLGLGLAIVKHLVELHEGSIHATSPGEGQGATFAVSLPLTSPRDSLSSADFRRASAGIDGCETTNLSGVKVLVVDDDNDARNFVRRLLIECKAEVRTAASGAEALEMIRQVRPDVLVSDIGMPGMDGYEFIRAVRAGLDATALPAAALTAFARSEDRRRALLAGYQSHMAKPIEPAELLAVIASLAGRTGVQGKAAVVPGQA